MKNRTYILILITCVLVIVFIAFFIRLHNPIQTKKGMAVFEIYDGLDGKPLDTANIIVMDIERAFNADENGKAIIQIDNKLKNSKEFMGYTVMILSEDYLPMIIYNVGVYPAEKPESAMRYTVELKKPEPFVNTSYCTQFLPTSNTEMAGIIEYYKRLIKD